MLRRLLQAHPELQAEANKVAASMFVEVERSEVADEECSALEAVSTADVGARSGRQRGRGYVDPSEAAWELLGAAVEPFVTRLRQLAGGRLREAATEAGAGILLGLAEGNRDDECVIFFETDFTAEQKEEVLAAVTS